MSWFRFALIAASLIPSIAHGQGLRISTEIVDVSVGPDGKPVTQVLSGSLTLCHNGRVYDYVSSVDELVIYDPIEKSFTLLRPSRKMAATVTFDEIIQHLQNRDAKTKQYLEELAATGLPTAAKEADLIRFQMHPRFTETFDPVEGKLVLSADSFTYRVDTRKWEDVEQVDRYLTYRDWMARLNSVLHPEGLFPETRMALHEALRRQKNRMPVRVELDRRPAISSRLRADHKLTMGLMNSDHDHIAQWEDLLKSKEVSRVPLIRYQQTALVSRR